MAELILNRISEALGFGTKCCSKCIFEGEKETLQCYDLDPPQIVNEISKINNKNTVIGLDCNQKEHEEDLARDAARKVFGTDLENSSTMKREERIIQEENNVPKLDLLKQENQKTIKFEDCN
ncbi:unnamed protein product [Cryptosporidium hominis]|uniref:Uncharacterized protein n=1 Tax=Cryptosporidium hominis TaxID=237895 RepID=A0A0S4TDN5_CRYHO|nr:hypothetical protein [Cryptosporidium hominis TU502]OLQ16037.1 hypothetical protein ChTU502y2012_313g0050 [Cryptosporidium hominis]PPA63299.1 hypothetical protein ChUKH1_09540 [Cryptosporidium hominis]PPS93738.1 Uncharacterized protein GY17_00002580 [Cryptosporidium hominis]CUV05293.1 unnamed protein product [Cryptosporidium hominis]|eukprot:PPS93738.1 Uncharacterized protein GY17_00002580 [Cryptosporidium hominis]